jgi:hypothetical protein
VGEFPLNLTDDNRGYAAYELKFGHRVYYTEGVGRPSLTVTSGGPTMAANRRHA